MSIAREELNGGDRYGYMNPALGKNVRLCGYNIITMYNKMSFATGNINFAEKTLLRPNPNSHLGPTSFGIGRTFLLRIRGYWLYFPNP